MITARAKNLILLLALLITPLALFSQDKIPDQDKSTGQGGMVEFGGRSSWGEVYGRPDLPFQPSLKTSKYDEYRDLRDGFFISRARMNWDNLDSKYFLDFQSNKAIYRDQSYLATFGEWNRFKFQFRYDEIPHTYSDTARTLYTQTARGVFTIPLLTRSTLQSIAATAATTLPSTIQTQLAPSMSFFTPAIERRAGTLLFDFDVTPEWDLSALFSREHETGARPMGTIFNSSPSAALTGGYGEEVPEPIDYFNNTVKLRTEYVRERFVMQFGYTGSVFQNNTGALVFDNPFVTADCVAPTGCTNATQGPATGRTDLYPNNYANYINFAGSFLLMKHLRLLASINAGWLRQNDLFLPYTTNSILEATTGLLPAPSLDGKKRTLAMNYKVIETIGKKFEIKAGYRQYDYNNDTPILNLTPVEGDMGAPNLASPTQNTNWGYNRKNVEVTGNWYFAKKSTAKIGYEGELMDRSQRDVAHSKENGFVAAVDTTPRKDLTFRASYRHSVRNPEHYVDDNATSASVSGGITGDQVFSRRFDEANRTRNRGDIQLQYSPTDRLSFSGFGGTLQDNYNHAGGVNSATALNFISGTMYPYFSYGVLKDLSYNAGFDSDISLTNNITFFAEYSYERYYKAMASRYRVPGNGATPTPLDCSNSSQGCDSANNDWGSNSRDYVHVAAFGFDTHVSKKANFNTYYSLSAAKGHVDSRPFGDPTLLTGPDKFLLTGTNAAMNYPETVSRNHELVAVFRYKLTKNVTPKIEYRYQQFDSKDYQTSAMTPYMGCVSGAPPSAAVPGCATPIGTSSTTVAPYFFPTPNPSFYPYFVVGDPSAARYLFMGVDQPSYHAHYLAGTLEYSF
jgi:MtrB/PioB family decaheme-associated outer membrane protein